MNRQDVISLNWPFLRQNKLRTVQGEAIFDIFIGQIIIDGPEFKVSVFAGDEIQEILLGSQWLKQFTLIAKYQESSVTLERS